VIHASVVGMGTLIAGMHGRYAWDGCVFSYRWKAGEAVTIDDPGTDLTSPQPP
jgi:hypothetical protein